MSLNLRQTVADFLKSHTGERFTARQLAQWLFDNHRAACEEKRARAKQNLADDDALVQQLVREIGANRPDIQRRFPQVRTTETRPRQYFYSSASDEEEVARAEGGKRGGKAPGGKVEQDLYPLLSRYLRTEFGLCSKRIDEKTASNRRGPNGNKWLYPDMVAMEDLSAEWGEEIRSCVREYGDKRARLWSFEVKLLLNRANVREAWFQAVSNSSWANFGYLVAAEVEGNAMGELRMLAAAHGIGLIQLNVADPSESEIVIPARERPAIDWDSCNRLAEENKDFRAFVKLVRQFHQTGDLPAGDWDLPGEDE